MENRVVPVDDAGAGSLLRVLHRHPCSRDRPAYFGLLMAHMLISFL